MMAEFYSQEKVNNEKLQKRVKRYKAQLPQSRTVAVPMFINEDVSVGKIPLSPLTTYATPSADSR